jgi:5-deoxy-glucuronate isomerase
MGGRAVSAVRVANAPLYHLHAMAGPGERAWRFRDDPAHAWTRDTRTGRTVDPRLPMAPARRPA